MNKREILDYLTQLKKKKNVKVYTPFKYFQGLGTKKEIYSRFLDILKGSKSDFRMDDSYTGYSTDLNKKTKKSRYTVAFEKRFGTDCKSLEQKSKITGVPIDILERVFNKGRAAWRTGHRVGANEQQWGYARVHSFLTLGCTAFSADFSLLKEAITRIDKKHLKKWLCQPIMCPLSTLHSAYYKKIGAKTIIDKYIARSC